MRVLLLGDPRSWHCEKWARAFRERGWEVLWVGFEGPPLEGAHFLSLPGPKPVKYLLGALVVLLKARRFKPDLVNAHMVTGYGLVGALVKGKAKLLLSAWGPDLLESPRRPLRRLAVRLALKGADLVQTDADVMDEILVEDLGFPAEKIVQVPYGLEDELLEEPLPQKPEPPPWVVVSHRRLDPLYNPRVILEAAALLRKKGVKVEVVLSSGGSLEGELRELAWKLGVKAEITGFVPRKALLSNLRRAHIFVSAALSDSTPVSLLEAMALGAVPVVSDLPALAQWITPGVNGLLFNPEDPEELAERILWALERPWFLEEARRINKRLVRERGSWRRAFERVLEKLPV